MKKIGYCFILFSFITAGLAADVYIRETTHTDSYYYGGITEPASDTTGEIWFAGNRLAYVTAGRIVIVDENSGQISVINRRDKTFVQSGIPLDIKKIISPEIYAALTPRQMSGQVSETNEIRTIGEWKCTGYDIRVDQPYALEIKTWCSTDVPFDWNQLNNLFDNIRTLANYSQAYIKEQKKMKGFAISGDVTIFLQGITFGSKSRVEEISEKQAFPDTYTVPREFQKKDLLSIEDLRNR
jgi:hypothetical protein